MIKYLSGDLSPEESLKFDKELSEDQELQNDFSDVSQAYRIIGEQVKREDEEAYATAVRTAMDLPCGTGSFTCNFTKYIWPLSGERKDLRIQLQSFN